MIIIITIQIVKNESSKHVFTSVHIFPISIVHSNAYCLKSKVQKLGFLHASIVTNNELMLLTIEGKWLKVIVHMTSMHS